MGKNNILSFVTLSGIDDQVSIRDLIDLKEEYENIEYGILYSYKNLGTSRYPSAKYIRSLCVSGLGNLSLHLCGSVIKDFCTSDGNVDNFLNEFGNLIERFNRIQINFSTKYTSDNIDFDILENNISRKEFQYIEFIIQAAEDFNIISWALNKNLSILQDQSSGTGKLAKVWWYSFGDRFGYAGGLDPTNLENQLIEIREKQKISSSKKIWIDAESGLRTNDEFDLTKVRKFLNISKRYMKK